MRRRSTMVTACISLLVALSGCGTDAVEAEHSTSPAVVGPPSQTAPASVEQRVGEATSSEAGNQVAGPIDPSFGKRCYAACSVVSVGAPSCPASIGGFGNTTFLGGCNKACRKAEGDAASKLPAGCVINTCNFSGC